MGAQVKGSRSAGAIWILVAWLGAGCAGGLSATNVGEPSPQARADFESRLALVRPGMPADSLELLFAPATEPGAAGILRRTRVTTAAGESGTVSLGWRSDPRHQIGRKTSREVEVERALVDNEGGRVLSNQRRH
jgi:hypothetical protein